MSSEKSSCLGADMVGLKAAMQAKAWDKYKLSARMSPAGNSSICSPVNVSAIDNCFMDNIANWEVWCGEPACMNDNKWLSKESSNYNGTCGQQR